jgi:hypothetical protein
MRACPAFGLVLLLGVAVVPPVRGQGADLEPVAIEGDLVVDKPVSYVGKHLKIRGNLVLAKGGELNLDNCVCELMCTYSREFLVQWRGGTLRTRNVTIGGSDHKGYMAQVNFELHDGLWEATDTTVRMSYGIVFSDKTAGRLRAKGFKAGVCPDSVILSGRGDAFVEDSTFQFSLNLTAARGDRIELDLRQGEPVSRVFDGKILRDPEARLELKNVTVPHLWWVFVHDVKMDGPPCEVVVSGNGDVIPGILAWNLKGVVPFVPDLRQPFRAGNLTLSRAGETVRVQNMSYYLSGAETDVTVPGPTTLNEVMVWDGRMAIRGTSGTHDIAASCTSFDVFGKGELSIANAELGIPRAWGAWNGLGQIAVSDEARLVASACLLRKIQLITKDKGTMAFTACERQEDVSLRQNGGHIQFEGARRP